ncbi:HNH endonuclease [Arthrobacter sp. ok362]|uniref:HNH endonuclease n=1 Tax=Arthrobacter sp. ok362 TaxID=1761745 RepID=UPI00088C437F|nr:HNH endonuclease signature motif containing protein [Arthrobacter sp. ok362]SDL77439.1 5-methylcytosine-specific restriction endonuclease McrA [Arthrobacter sp. ok362]
MLELKRIYWIRQALRLAMAGLTVWIFAGVIFALLANFRKPTAGQRATTVTAIFSQMFDGVLAAVAFPGVLVVVLIVTVLIIQARDVRRRDPVRQFTRQQRREGMARADGQCEMEAGFRRRCSRPAEHGDHFYPWSKGGSTSLQNFVAACSRCNRAKGARIPSPAQQQRLERRRRTYVTLDAVAVGERQALG